MGLLVDLKLAADNIAKEFSDLGYRADYSVESLQDVDRFFEQNVHASKPSPGAQITEATIGKWVFGSGAYLGEVLVRLYGGSWRVDDSDPKAAISAEVVFPSGARVWPIQRVAKRYRQGSECDIYHFALALSQYATTKKNG